jgi:hypothetical protein
MTFIRTQNLRRDDNGMVMHGTASVCETRYVKGGKYHSIQESKESLGRVIWLSEDGKSGIFMSKTRGLVAYDAVADAFGAVDRGDARIKGTGAFPETDVHTVFGDSHLFLRFLEKSSLLGVLRAVFPRKQDFERLLCHTLHAVMRDGSRISCDNYISKSFAAYVLGDVPVASLKTDTAFFTMMGEDTSRMAFFKAFVKAMREIEPGFGRGCYVDSTPLPNDISDNPFNALCSHGLGSVSVQTRLALVLDEATGLPVWYDVIPGNLLDLATTMTLIGDVETSLGIDVDSFVLDAGYVTKELVGSFHVGTDKTFVGRMPVKKGFPHKELYREFKDQLGRGKYQFVRQGHTYFGRRKETELFGRRVFAYVYVDKNALQRFGKHLLSHEEEYAAMKDKDKDWTTVKYGYFVLVSNIEAEPADMLSMYFARTEIESVFKTSKERLGLLPLSKWSVQTVKGKILHDIIATTALLLLRKQIGSSGISTTELAGKVQSLMCFRDSKGNVTVETPNKQTREYYGMLGISVPSRVKIDEFRRDVLGLE